MERLTNRDENGVRIVIFDEEIYSVDDIGKKVFLTSAEAEKELAERSKGDG